MLQLWFALQEKERNVISAFVSLNNKVVTACWVETRLYSLSHTLKQQKLIFIGT